MISWNELTSRSALTCPVGGWKPADIATAIKAILASATVPVEREVLGESFEGRPIELLKIGTGPKRALLWSQMHGDEPTHTTVLLNLLRLLSAQEIEESDAMLAGMTIGLIVPLNPDGAERNTRFNAQGIDVNRDALAFASPEGRALAKAVETFEPAYGFNLHNQQHRTGIGHPPVPAAVSLLVPPIDEEDTQNDSTEEATRVAAYFSERVRDRCEGRISRYEIDYMPRAFGEWSQRQGMATILIEAGGWPGGDFIVLEKLHFAGLVQTLEAIASDELASADPASYLDLQKSADFHLFDLLVRPAGVVQEGSAQLNGEATKGEWTSASIGVDYPHRKAGWYEFRDGVIRAIGDLHKNGGLSQRDCPESIVAPGRIVLDDANEETDGCTADWNELAAAGVTTALISIDLSHKDLTQSLADLLTAPPSLNAALVGYWKVPPASKGAFYEQITMALAAGMVAILGPFPIQGSLSAEEMTEVCDRLGTPVLPRKTTPKLSDPLPSTLVDWLAETSAIAEQLGWSDRGHLILDAAADFVFLKQAETLNAPGCLQEVYVGGTVVHNEDGPTVHRPGRWIA